MAEPYLGEIEYFAFNFAPKSWMQCRGQLMPISQNQALFSLLGTTYGGDGRTTFGLPDLQSRIAVGQGTGQGLSPYVLGQASGNETVTLLPAQIPSHSHSPMAVAHPPGKTSGAPAGNLVSVATDANGNTVDIYATGGATGTMSANTIANAGNNQGHENRMPYLGLTACICIAGIYPSRN